MWPSWLNSCGLVSMRQGGLSGDEKMTQHTTARGMKVFATIWFGQLVSLIGSGLTNFALGVWVYQRTGSVTQFALIALCATLPGIMLSPLAGVLVDRWDRRRAMIFSDCGAGLST